MPVAMIMMLVSSWRRYGAGLHRLIRERLVPLFSRT